jgi:predicted site-specific integrase-resolvase
MGSKGCVQLVWLPGARRGLADGRAVPVAREGRSWELVSVAISQVLRHQDRATTALYAKVDLHTLRRVAQPWPGTAR